MKNLLLAIVLMCSTAVYSATDSKTVDAAHTKYVELMIQGKDAVSALKTLLADGFSSEVVFEIALLHKIDLSILAPTAAGNNESSTPDTSVPFRAPPASTFNGGGGSGGSRS